MLAEFTNAGRVCMIKQLTKEVLECIINTTSRSGVRISTRFGIRLNPDDDRRNAPKCHQLK